MATPSAAPSTKSLEEVLDDLCSRFIINLPNEEFESFDRLCFQIEAAHWFYLDFFREEIPSLPVFNLKEFVRQMFQHCPLLQPYRGSVDQILANFTQYKVRVPACGAIILNPTLDKCLLVKGWTNRSSWGFPKGKINKDEKESDCAVREVFEETSFDITPYLKEEDHIELILRETEQRVKLFIIAGVPEDTFFYPRTRKEISKISWFPLSEFKTEKNIAGQPAGYVKEGKALLPTPTFPATPGTVATTKSKNYFMVIPFVSKLKVWLKRKRPTRKSANPPDQNIITIYDSSIHSHITPSTTPVPAPSSNPTPNPNPAPTPAPIPTPSIPIPSNAPANKSFIPLPEPISLMHLLTPPRHSSAPDITTPASAPHHRPIPHPVLPFPAPYPIPYSNNAPPPPQNIHMTPPHQIQSRTPFQTPPFHTPPHAPQTYQHAKAAPFVTPHTTPQPKTQPSTPYTPYPISPPTSPIPRDRAAANSPQQMQLTKNQTQKEVARNPRSKPRRKVDFGNEQSGQPKSGNALTNFKLNADEIMKCFVQL